MDWVEGAPLEPADNRPASDPSPQELLSPDHAMLALGQVRQQTIDAVFALVRCTRLTFDIPQMLNVSFVRGG